MRKLRALWVRLRGLFGGERAEAEISGELESHLAMHIEDNLRAGMTPEEARRQAAIRLGGIEQTRQVLRERRTLPWMEALGQDVRFALRQLRKSPGYALTAVLTLALGVGANSAVFTVINDAMLRSLPVERPDQLVTIGYLSPKAGRVSIQLWPVMQELNQHLRGISGIAGWSGSMVTFPDDQNTLRSIAANLVTGNALSMLGVRPVLGRLLIPSDDVPGGPVGGWPVVLDYGFWLANFHGDPGIVGHHLLVSGQPATIVGVLPPDFHGLFVGQPQKLYLPLHFLSVLATTPAQDPFQHPQMLAMVAVARLQPGTSLRALNVQLKAMSPAIVQTLVPPRIRNMPRFQNAQLNAESARRGFSEIAEDYGKPLLLIQGIVLAVLLLCCVNLAGLQMARVQAREQEFAVRTALGAGRGRILRQCFVESLLLAAFGSFFAAGLAWASVRIIAGFFTPAGSPDSTQLQPDAMVLVFTAAFALVTALLFGMAPAWAAGGVSPGTVLKSKGTNARHHLLRQRLFVPAQFALALVLVFTAGLFTHTLVRLRSNDAGFNPDHVMQVCAQFQTLKKSPGQIMELYRSMTDFLRTAPGVQAAAYTWVTPVTGFAPRINAHNVARPQDIQSIAYNDVGDGYFATIGTHLLAGREFTTQDRDRSTCVVNQAAAKLLFPGGRALDNSLAATNTDDQMTTFKATCRVVGIVENARYSSLRDPAPPTVYFPAWESTVGAAGYANDLVFLIRSDNAGDAISAYRAALARFAPNTGYMTFLPLTEQVDQSIGSERLIARFSGIFAAVALLLSGIGLFGVLALRVQQRRAEIGVRLAVGASRGRILALILRDALSMLAAGTLAGIALIALTSTFVRRFLYDTSPVQIGVVLSTLLILAAVGLLAALLPARRAAAVDPMQALRTE
jgi:predicted permease